MTQTQTPLTSQTPETDWIEPVSSNILRFGYQHHRSTLIIEFKNRNGESTGTYEYSDVSPSLFEAMRNAESAGKFFYANIKGSYREAKIES